MNTYQQQAPNCDRLLNYIKKSSWQHVSANFTGFVKKELESTLEKLGEVEGVYPNLQRLVKDAELGRFTSTKELRDQAEADLRDIQRRLADLDYERKTKNTARGHHPQIHSYSSNAQQSHDRYTPIRDRQEMYSPIKTQRDEYGTNRQETYSPMKRGPQTPQKRDTYTPQKRDTYTPQKRDTYTPQKRNTYTPQKQEKRDIYTPDKRPPYSPMKAQREIFSPADKFRGNPESDGYRYTSPGRHEIAERGPRTHLKSEQNYEQPSMDPHKENFDSLRLKSPDKGYGDHINDARPAKQGSINSKDQSSSSAALWGRDHGDSHSEKIANSTYRQAFPGHNVDNSERQDKNRYRENFSSLNERTSWARMENGGISNDRSRPNSERLKSLGEPATPDNRPPMDLVIQFKDLFNTEWKDAYDETCSVFGGPEKTVRHLLWIVTEAYLIACDIADHQLKDLEKQAFGVMVTPGSDTEAWLISIDIADRQLKDLQNNSVRIMTIPGSASTSISHRDHMTGYRGRELGDALPKSKSLLVQYRKQTAPLSVPYVRETCRDKISRTLMESVNFPKTYLNDASRLVAYIYKCGELTWMMSVNDPPIVLEYITKDTEGARFNKEHYVEYTRSGTHYDYGVWPLLRHGKNGRVLWKGIAQGI